MSKSPKGKASNNNNNNSTEVIHFIHHDSDGLVIVGPTVVTADKTKAKDAALPKVMKLPAVRIVNPQQSKAKGKDGGPVVYRTDIRGSHGITVVGPVGSVTVNPASNPKPEAPLPQAQKKK